MAGQDGNGGRKAGFMSRLVTGGRFLFKGEAPAGWFGPLEPLSPVAPPEAAGRQFDYAPGYNLISQPRASEPISFRQLRGLADAYDLLRLVIETRKDQIANMEWSIQNRDETARAAEDPRVKQVSDFLAFPDQERGWDEWLRMLMEDMLVIDAATIYPRRTIGGKLFALDLVDGATIKRVIDDWGRTPAPPAPAYQQVLKGLPASNYAADALFYLPRNPRTDRVYGYSPVEQVIMSVNIALRRQIHQLQYYTEGSIPEALIGVPETWSPDQIGQFQSYWDALLEGDTAARRHARFVPATISKSFVQTKEATLKDEYDEWLARIVCYALNVPAQWAIKQMNRATAETAQEQALAEGLAPVMKWVKGVMDRLLARAFGFPDLEFIWAEEDEVSPSEQANVNKTYLAAGVLTINEVRDDIGRDPIEGGDEPLIYTATGAVKLDDVLNPPPAPAPIPSEDPPAPDDQSEAEATGAAKLAKAARRDGFGRPVPRDRPALHKAEAALGALWAQLLQSEGRRIAAHAAALVKAEDDGSDDPLHAGAWAVAQTQTARIIADLAKDGVSEGYAAIGVSTDLANPRAVSWAEDHSAQLVSGLTATTRQGLRALIAKSEAEGWSVQQLGQAIESAYDFSADRASLIAHMETRTADIEGNLIAWKSAKEDLGIKVLKRWITRGDNICPECEANEADGAIDADDTFTSGDDAPPAHVNCECDVEPEIAADEES